MKNSISLQKNVSLPPILFVDFSLVNEIVQQSINCQAGDGFDACFADDVLAVCDDGVNRYEQLVGNLLVCHAFHKGD